MNLPFIWQILFGFLLSVLTPYFYVGIVLLGLAYWRQNLLERKLFGVRATEWKKQVGESVLYGSIVGAFVSLGSLTLGLVIRPEDITWIWCISLVLALIRVRFICFSYSVGLLSLLSLFVQAFYLIFPLTRSTIPLLSFLLHFRVAPLLCWVALLHLAEAVLVFLQGDKSPSPLFVAGKRGRIVGGFLLQKFWLLPIALFTFTGTAAPLVGSPSWWPIFPGAGSSGLQIMPLPAVLGFSGVSTSSTPKMKAHRNAKLLVVYSLLLLLFSYLGAIYWMWLWGAALFAPLAHEFILWVDKREESAHPARFIKSESGLRILSVLPGSPAEAMGLLPEEVIVKVNQCPVSTPFDLHFAINQNPAYTRLEVKNLAGEVRFLQKPIYEGMHHSLGLILVPDESAREYVHLESIPFWKSIWRNAKRKGSNGVIEEVHTHSA